MELLSSVEYAFLMQMLYRLYECNTYEDFSATFFMQIRRLIPFEKGIIFLLNQENETIFRTRPYTYPGKHSYAALDRFIDSGSAGSSNEYIFAPWSSVYRQSDVIPLDHWENSSIYQSYWATDHIYYGLTVTMVYADTPIGTITMHRTRDMNDFSSKDVAILDILKNHLALKLYQLTKGHGQPRMQQNQVQAEAFYVAAARFGITRREAEIIYMVYMGQQRTEIAKKLFISEATLRKHIYNIYGKINVSSQSQLIVWVRDHIQ